MFFALTTNQKNKPYMEILIAEYSKIPIRLCCLILKDTQLAEDAAWETLYKTYKGYNKGGLIYE